MRLGFRVNLDEQIVLVSCLVLSSRGKYVLKPAAGFCLASALFHVGTEIEVGFNFQGLQGKFLGQKCDCLELPAYSKQ